MADYPSRFVRTDQPTAQIAAMGDGHREFLHFMLEHICLCVVKEYLDGDGQGGKLNSLPLLNGEFNGSKACHETAKTSVHCSVLSF